MPNQSDQNQPQPADQSAGQPVGSAPPVISPQMDLPPLPPELSAQETPPSEPVNPVTPVEPPANETLEKSIVEPPTGSAAPPNLPSMVGTPKKKFGGGKIIATILGVLLLVGGVGAGYLLTQQPQIFRGEAWEPPGVGGGPYQGDDQEQDLPEEDPPSDGGGGLARPLPPAQPEGTYPVYEGGASSGMVVGYRYIQAPGVFEGAITRAANGNTDDLALLISTYGMTQEDINNAAAHITNGETWVPAGVGCTGTEASETQGDPSFCGDWHWTTCEQAGSGIGGIGCGITTNEDDNNDGYDGVTPTPIPSPTASCLNIKAYDETFSSATPLTTTQLSALKAGSKVNFCVAGNASSGIFDKAQFKIGTTLMPETTSKHPDSQDFCQLYTILSTDTTVTVKAKINHVTLGWQGENF